MSLPRLLDRKHFAWRGLCLVAWAAVMTLILAPWVARADDKPSPKQLSKWPIDLAHPEQGIPTEKERNEDPLQFGYWIQDVAAKAGTAAKLGDHATAVKLYETLAKAVPDRAIGLLKACEEYEALGDLNNAINACGGALLADGLRVSDYTHFVRLMLSKPGDLGEKDQAALAKVVEHMREDPQGRPFAADVECQVGTRTTNVAQLEECTTELAARAPDDAKTLTYQWALAVAKGKFDDARAIGRRAGAAGVPAASVEAMERTASSQETARRWRRFFVAAGAALGLMALGLGVRFRRKLFGMMGSSGAPAQA